jgi:hypothetical protein
MTSRFKALCAPSNSFAGAWASRGGSRPGSALAFGMAQPVLTPSAVQPRPTLSDGGWTAQAVDLHTENGIRPAVQPKPPAHTHERVRRQAGACLRVYACTQTPPYMLAGWTDGQNQQRRGFAPSSLSSSPIELTSEQPT